MIYKIIFNNKNIFEHNIFLKILSKIKNLK
jgi:hypothetical protein